MTWAGSRKSTVIAPYGWEGEGKGRGGHAVIEATCIHVQDDLVTSWKEQFDAVEAERGGLVERLADSEALVG